MAADRQGKDKRAPGGNRLPRKLSRALRTALRADTRFCTPPRIHPWRLTGRARTNALRTGIVFPAPYGPPGSHSLSYAAANSIRRRWPDVVVQSLVRTADPTAAIPASLSVRYLQSDIQSALKILVGRIQRQCLPEMLDTFLAAAATNQRGAEGPMGLG